MNYSIAHPIAAGNESEYETSDDFRMLFTEDINGLYLLSFLLMASREEAENRFETGLADSVDGNPVFKEWARSWARSIIVHNVIKSIAPRISPARSVARASHSANEDNTPKTPIAS
jgi:hypothetical protein